MKILFIGDVVGEPGRSALKKQLHAIKDKLCPDVTVVNAENSAHGSDSPETAREEISFFFSGLEILQF